MKKREIQTTTVNPNETVTLSRAEYDRLKKNEYVANKLMQYLYDNSQKASYSNELVFYTSNLADVLQILDTEYYLYALDLRTKEAEKNEE